MPGNKQKPTKEFRHAELDPALLATPYEVQTNWRVITGAPCSGKTTLVEMLAGRGLKIVPESARTVIKEEVSKGRSMQEIRSDSISLQLLIEARQLQVENGLDPDEELLLDEAVPGALAWHRWYGLALNDVLRRCFRHRYATVFILERLPFKVDDERVPEMDAVANFVAEWYPRDFKALGYDVIIVPVMSPEKRLTFVLEHLDK